MSDIVIKVAGYFVALDMPDPRSNWREMIGSVVVAVGIGLAMFVALWAF